MDESRWHRTEQIFNQAILISENRRKRFVEETCGGDSELSHEVMSLLLADQQHGQVLEESVLPLVAQFFDEDIEKLLKMPNFAGYKLHRILGRGGIGAVFLAEDNRLERFVALKIIPARLLRNQETAQRFEQEARTASAISHHNVAHVYEFDCFDDTYFLAMEYVAGKTLRELLKENQMSLQRAVDVAIQIAHALGAAHRERIVHRDVKPENIMLTGDGLVKVLDFGLAKSVVNNQVKKTASLQTSPGIIMGTTAYMSPEQVRGNPVDERTDLWSLGVVLYELLSGERPFRGETASDVQANILLVKPAPLPIAHEIPALEKIVFKALAKNVSARYQSAADIIEDLRAAQRDVYDYNKQIHRVEPESRPSFKNFLNRLEPSFVKTLFAGMSLVAILLLAYTISLSFFDSNKAGILALNPTLQVSNSGKAVRAAVSPDGTFFAYVTETADGQQTLFLQQQKNDKVVDSRILIAASPQKYLGIAFSPRTEQVYFTRSSPNESFASLYSVPIEGGAASKVLDNVHNAPSFSPRGERMAFLRLSTDNSHEDVWLADANGKNERVLHRRAMPDFIPQQTQPSWSPNGQTVICAVGSYDNGKEQIYPLAIRVADGQTTRIFNDSWKEIWQLDWLGDGSGFLLVGRQNESTGKQLWHVSYPAGQATPVTTDSSDYSCVSTTRRASGGDIKIASVVMNWTAPLWKLDLSNVGNDAVQLTESENNSFGVSWTRTNKIVYGSMASGNKDIWMMEPDGTNRRQLTFDTRADSNPVVTPDERYIIFGSERSGTQSIWRMNLDGNEQTPLVQKASAESIAVSADSQTVYYYSHFDGTGALWRTPVTGGRPEKLAVGEFESLALSPDNRFIAASVVSPNSEERIINIWETADFSVPRRSLKPISGAQFSSAMRWSPDGNALVYSVSSHGVGNLWAQPLDNRSPIQLTNFTSKHLFAFDWSPSDQKIVYSRGEISGYAAMLSLTVK